MENNVHIFCDSNGEKKNRAYETEGKRVESEIVTNFNPHTCHTLGSYIMLHANMAIRMLSSLSL